MLDMFQVRRGDVELPTVVAVFGLESDRRRQHARLAMIDSVRGMRPLAVLQRPIHGGR